MFGDYSSKIGDPVPSVSGGACCFRWVSRLRTYRDRTAVGNVTNVICISTRVHKGLVAVQSFFMISFKFGHFFDPLSLLHTLCHMPLCHNMPNPPPSILCYTPSRYQNGSVIRIKILKVRRVKMNCTKLFFFYQVRMHKTDIHQFDEPEKKKEEFKKLIETKLW